MNPTGSELSNKLVGGLLKSKCRMTRGVDKRCGWESINNRHPASTAITYNTLNQSIATVLLLTPYLSSPPILELPRCKRHAHTHTHTRTYTHTRTHVHTLRQTWSQWVQSRTYTRTHRLGVSWLQSRSDLGRLAHTVGLWGSMGSIGVYRGP
jgi:hypothetical protein